MVLLSAVVDTGYDSVIYLGTKYILHKAIGHHYLMAIDMGDILAFVAVDGAFNVILNAGIAFSLTLAQYNYLVAKYAIIAIGVTAVNFVSGRSNRIIDNLINIGASAGVNKLTTMIIDRIK